MKPTIVLIGRPNVGKSTLFNRLTKTRDAIVADLPGLTRDRHYGHAVHGDKSYLVVDTGGLEPNAGEGIMHEMAKQTLQAIDEADAVFFIVDARDGLTPQDKAIAERLRRNTCPLFLVVNKAEGRSQSIATAEFFELGFGQGFAISAAHGEGIADLLEAALAPFEALPENEEDERHPKIAIVGRPNVGKSTLVNAMLGEERVIAFDQPGTTRDSIYIDFERDDKQFTIIDTAGVRKRGKIAEAIEKFSVIKTIQAIEDANVVVLVLDARQDISEQDAHLAGFILEAGRALVVAVNKWDGLSVVQRDTVKNDIARKLRFLDFAKYHFISALRGNGVSNLLKSISQAYAAAMVKLPTPKLTRILIAATAKQAPPQVGPHRPKLRYAHQGGSNPPLIIVHGSGTGNVPSHYVRFLENTFREALALQGTPLKIQFKQGSNPFAGKKPKPLTEREENKLRRQRRYGRKTYK